MITTTLLGILTGFIVGFLLRERLKVILTDIINSATYLFNFIDRRTKNTYYKLPDSPIFGDKYSIYVLTSRMLYLIILSGALFCIYISLFIGIINLITLIFYIPYFMQTTSSVWFDLPQRWGKVPHHLRNPDWQPRRKNKN